MSELREIEDEMRQHPDPVVSVPELTERLDYSDTKIRENLKLLEREGVVESKQVGARAVAWWHEDRVTPRHVAPEDHPDQTDLQETPARERRESDGGAVGVEEAVGRLDLPGGGERQEQREEAMRSLLRHLRDAGETDAEELRTLTYDHCETGYSDARSWWKNCASAALSELRDDEIVTLVDPHDGVWAWNGGER
jgi:DNA-binding transcriptional ArsR family regulator